MHSREVKSKVLQEGCLISNTSFAPASFVGPVDSFSDCLHPALLLGRLNYKVCTSCANVLSCPLLPALANRQPRRGENRREVGVKLFIPRPPSSRSPWQQFMSAGTERSLWVQVRVGNGAPLLQSVGSALSLRVSLYPSHTLLNSLFVKLCTTYLI